jgi:hypothetical protein
LGAVSEKPEDHMDENLASGASGKQHSAICCNRMPIENETKTSNKVTSYNNTLVTALFYSITT